MAQSESTAKLASALARAQAKFTTIKKDKTGQEGNLKFSYAALPDGLAVVRPLLNAEGIYLSQPIVEGSDGVLRQTTKVQLAEEWDQSAGIPLPKISPGKELGKIITYARRIDLFPFLGISGEDDDEDAPDLKKGTTPPQSQQNKPFSAQFPNKLPNDPEAARKIAQEKAFKKEAFKEQPKSSPTDFNFGKNVPENGNGKNPEITSEDLPKEMFSEQVSVEQPLSEEAENAASGVDAPETLSQERHTYIQDRLKELVTQKKFSTKAVSGYLEARHNGKKLVYVPSVTAENTLKLIEEAVEAGPAAVKELFNGAK
jgi:hypothetical protein